MRNPDHFQTRSRSEEVSKHLGKLLKTYFYMVVLMVFRWKYSRAPVKCSGSVHDNCIAFWNSSRKRILNEVSTGSRLNFTGSSLLRCILGLCTLQAGYAAIPSRPTLLSSSTAIVGSLRPSADSAQVSSRKASCSPVSPVFPGNTRQSVAFFHEFSFAGNRGAGNACG